MIAVEGSIGGANLFSEKKSRAVSAEVSEGLSSQLPKPVNGEPGTPRVALARDWWRKRRSSTRCRPEPKRLPLRAPPVRTAATTANAVATSIATGALKPRVAVLMSAALNFAGAFISISVAATIAKGIVNPKVLAGGDGLVLVLAALLGAMMWNLTCSSAPLLLCSLAASRGRSQSSRSVVPDDSVELFSRADRWRDRRDDRRERDRRRERP
jgi:hypothetical protein